LPCITGNKFWNGREERSRQRRGRETLSRSCCWGNLERRRKCKGKRKIYTLHLELFSKPWGGSLVRKSKRQSRSQQRKGWPNEECTGLRGKMIYYRLGPPKPTSPRPSFHSDLPNVIWWEDERKKEGKRKVHHARLPNLTTLASRSVRNTRIIIRSTTKKKEERSEGKTKRTQRSRKKI